MPSEVLHKSLKEIITDYNPAGEDTLAQYAIDGMTPEVVVSPDSIASLAAVVQLASEYDYGIIPWGSGTKMDIGLPPTRADIIVQLDRMNQVLEYEPADQAITVQAGIRLSDLQSHLGSQGQYWPLDPPHGETCTLGGILATNASGLLRMTFGTARDIVIGLRVVQADGTIVKSGGKVVKNVAGYDLNKMYIGSLGTLGIMAEITLKLQPLPEIGHIIIGLLPSISTVMDTAFKLLESDVMPTFIELANPVLIALLSRQVGGNSVDAGFPIIAGIMGQEETVKWQVEACERLFQEMGAGQIVHMEDERYQIALKLLRSFPTGQVVSSDMMSGITCRASVTPEQIENLYQLAENSCQKSSMGCGMLAHFSSGHMSFVFYQEVPFEEPHLDILAGIINDLQQAAVESGGSLVVEHAPAALKSRVEVWGPARDDLPIMRMLKNKLDPKGILNNCRFIGGI